MKKDYLNETGEIVKGSPGCQYQFFFPIQGAGADGFKMTLIDLDKQLSAHDARIVHILHDEIKVKAR